MEMVSIIIPARNEEKYISKCIDSIIAQDYPNDKIEIVVVDGMSTDKTEKIVTGYINSNKNVKLIKNTKFITPIALNLGITNSAGEIIIILGAHSYIDKDFVKNNVRNLTTRDIKCSGGVVKFLDEGYFSKCVSQATSCTFGAGNALFRYTSKEQFVDTVPFAAYKRKTFEELGLFDEELIRNQDDEFNFRVTQSGGKILLSPDIISFYFSRSSFSKLWRQYRQYGYWKVRVIQKHKKPAALRHLVPMLFVLSIILTFIVGFLNPIFRSLFYFISILYISIDILYSIKLSIKTNIANIACLPIIFPILHIGYGIGFLQGVVHFNIINKFRMNNNK